MASKRVKAKKSCCNSEPRCKRCPVVLKRLERAGYAQRVGGRSWDLVKKPKKKVMRAARA